MNPPFDLATVEAPFFEPAIGQTFRARPTEGTDPTPLELELIVAQPFHHRPLAGGRAPFSLLFRPLQTASLAQGTYECSGPGLEAVPIFLVPVRDALRGLCLEAVFN